MMMFSKTLIDGFRLSDYDGQRVGQAYYNYLKLSKVRDPEAVLWADQLWNTDGEKAHSMVRSRIDHGN